MTFITGSQTLIRSNMKRLTDLSLVFASFFLLASFSCMAAYGRELSSSTASDTCIQLTEPLLSIETQDEVFAFDITQCQTQKQVNADLLRGLLGKWNGDLEKFTLGPSDLKTALGILKTDDRRGDGTPAYSKAAIQEVLYFYSGGKLDGNVLVGDLQYSVFGGTGIKSIVVFYIAGINKILVLTKLTYSE